MLRQVSRILITALLVAPAAPAQERKAFAVGTALASPGQKALGFIEVPAGVDPGTRIPVAVIQGARSGPVLSLVAGSHGTEYASIIALEKLIGLLEPAAVSGTVIVLPLVNVPSFEQKVAHLNPVDGKNMNRTYPGKPDGTQSERASYLITREVVEPCDHLVDFHGGDIDESLRPYTYWTQSGNEKQDRTSREMALAFGLDHIIISTGRPSDPAASVYLENTATTRGKPSITVEAGHAGTVEPEDVRALVEGTLSLMRYLKMLPGDPTPVENPVWIERVASLAGGETGMFYPLVRRGSYVQKGMKLGYVTDYLGKVVFEARAPEAGVVLFLRAVPSLTRGEPIANIGVVLREKE
jgi:hypothetical protein